MSWGRLEKVLRRSTIAASSESSVGSDPAGELHSRASRCEGCAIPAVDAECGPCKNGVLIRSQENKFPGVFLALVFDPRSDHWSGVALAGVLDAVGQDRDNDFAGTQLFGSLVEFLTETINGKTNGIQ